MNGKIHKPGDILIQRYEILAYLAEGGMQQVYLARDRAFDRNVALKVPKNLSAEKRFKRSASVSARVIHSNVAATLDYFEDDSRGYLIEEFIDGVTLAERLENEFLFLDPHLAAHVIHRLARGVSASHRAGVHHRDLKPSNIMVSRDPGFQTVKITDFGIAKMMEDEISDAFRDEVSTTGSQTVMGALPYMAPEMIVDQKTAALSADIWALGAILFQMMTGGLPFGRGLGAVPAILNAQLPPKPRLFDQKPQFRLLAEGLWLLIISCMRKEPGDRLTADQLVSECAKLCYSDAPRSKGILLTFPLPKLRSCGFIEPDGTADRVFFHLDSLYGPNAATGMRVNFASFPGSPRARAFPVLPLK